MSQRSETANDGARRGGRPRGEERVAIADAAKWWQTQRLACPLLSPDGDLLVGATGMELMQRARVGRHVSAVVLKNMVRSGELVKLGSTEVVGVERLLTVYALAERVAPRWIPVVELANAVGAMSRLQG